MDLNLLHKTDGTYEITVTGAGYATSRTFAWYSDAVSILIQNYDAKYLASMTPLPEWTDVNWIRSEHWTSVKGEVLSPRMFSPNYK